MSVPMLPSGAIQIVRTEQQHSGPKTAEDIDKMSPAERFAYCRQFDQSKMPDWRDPRGS